jgi:hypothetical protein
VDDVDSATYDVQAPSQKETSKALTMLNKKKASKLLNPRNPATVTRAISQDAFRKGSLPSRSESLPNGIDDTAQTRLKDVERRPS